MERNASDEGTLHLPSGINYACLECGRSCEMFDEVEVDAETLDRWRSLPIAELAATNSGGETSAAYLESPWTPGKQILPKQGDLKSGRPCSFLKENKLCSIQCEFGFDLKPRVCRTFPFRFVETPGGVFTGLSFACTAVLQNHGPAVSSQESELLATQANSPTRDARGEILLAPQLPVSWDQYSMIESDLVDLLDAGAGDIGKALIAQSAYLNMLSKFLHEARHASNAPPGESPEANDRAISIFRRDMLGKPPARKWDRLLRIAEKPSGAPLLRRVCLGYVLAVRRRHESRPGRLAGTIRVLWSYLRHGLGAGEIELPYGLGRWNYRDVRKIRFDPSNPEHNALLRRFFSHCLFRKDLLLADDVKFGHNMMLMHYGLLQWFACAMALRGGRNEVSLEDLTEALRMVETHFGWHYSAFSKMFTGHPKLQEVVEGMFQRPIFAFAMARPERS